MNLEKHSILVAGGLGGVFTSVYDKAGWLMAGDAPMWTVGQWVGLVVFFVMGASVVWLFEEQNRKKAFLLGLGLPAFLTVAQTNAGPGPAPDSTAFLQRMEAFATAHAQERVEEEPGGPEPEPAASAGARTLTIKPADDEACPEGTLTFYAETRDLGKIPLDGCTEAIEVPAGATHFGIAARQANPNRFELVEGQALEYELRYEYSFWNDLRSGLGNLNLRPYDLELVPVSGGKEPPEAGSEQPGAR